MGVGNKGGGHHLAAESLWTQEPTLHGGWYSGPSSGWKWGLGHRQMVTFTLFCALSGKFLFVLSWEHRSKQASFLNKEGLRKFVDLTPACLLWHVASSLTSLVICLRTGIMGQVGMPRTQSPEKGFPESVLQSLSMCSRNHRSHNSCAFGPVRRARAPIVEGACYGTTCFNPIKVMRTDVSCPGLLSEPFCKRRAGTRPAMLTFGVWYELYLLRRPHLLC